MVPGYGSTRALPAPSRTDNCKLTLWNACLPLFEFCDNGEDNVQNLSVILMITLTHLPGPVLPVRLEDVSVKVVFVELLFNEREPDGIFSFSHCLQYYII